MITSQETRSSPREYVPYWVALATPATPCGLFSHGRAYALAFQLFSGHTSFSLLPLAVEFEPMPEFPVMRVLGASGGSLSSILRFPPSVLHAICDFLVYDASISSKEDFFGIRAVVNLSATSRALHEPALNALWHTIPDVSLLFYTMPDECFVREMVEGKEGQMHKSHVRDMTYCLSSVLGPLLS